MSVDWIDFSFGLQAFVILSVIMDPPGAAPLFLSMVGDKTLKEQQRLAWQAAGTSLLVITVFAICGQWILDYLKISLPALKGAGGLLLLLISLDLLRGNSQGMTQSKNKNVALVPLGTPLLAGPGAIVTVMIFVQDSESWAMHFGLAIAVIAVHILIGVTLMFSTKIVSAIKEAGVELLTRIAGLLLAAIAVEMLVSTVKDYFPNG